MQTESSMRVNIRIPLLSRHRASPVEGSVSASQKLPKVQLVMHFVVSVSVPSVVFSL
jgi:hypothetical protein